MLQEFLTKAASRQVFFIGSFVAVEMDLFHPCHGCLDGISVDRNGFMEKPLPLAIHFVSDMIFEDMTL